MKILTDKIWTLDPNGAQANWNLINIFIKRNKKNKSQEAWDEPLSLQSGAINPTSFTERIIQCESLQAGIIHNTS